MVLRPPKFQKHDVDYLIQCSPAGGSGGGRQLYDCRRVPPHLRRVHWTTLLSGHMPELAEQLVLLLGSHAKDVLLARIEDPRYIHSYIAPPGSAAAGGSMPAAAAGARPVLLELPRFGLEFLVQAGGLASLDYSGYRLRPRQQLVQEDERDGSVRYTLPGFTKYLVLERLPGSGPLPAGASRRADILMVLPQGLVVKGPGPAAKGGGSGCSSAAHVQLSGACDAALKVRCFPCPHAVCCSGKHGLERRVGDRAASTRPRKQTGNCTPTNPSRTF